MNKKDVVRTMNNSKATLSFEGLTPSSNALKATTCFLEGKITKQEARAQIMRKYSVKS